MSELLLGRTDDACTLLVGAVVPGVALEPLHQVFTQDVGHDNHLPQRRPLIPIMHLSSHYV